ncbi:MAG: type VI secretion system tip protein VgrG [Kiritimatiellae bacterium]|nr:type VI secretion system tip protein VgrG [Kiritimatiellia bacterium]
MPPEPTQTERILAITTPLGDDVLLLQNFYGREAIGQLFEFDLDLLSSDHEINFDDIVGQNVTVRLTLPDGTRHFNGYISRFVQTVPTGGYAQYRATMVPWLWMLSRTTNCRIFQDVTVLDIIKDVFNQHGFSDIEERVDAGSYKPWHYCVQYRESDFNFVSRLMEHEGIYYYFKHEDGKHTLVLCDSPDRHDAFANYAEIVFRPEGEASVQEEHVYDWTIRHDVQPGVYVHADYDFTKSRTPLQNQARVSHAHAKGEYEVYDYPGIFLESGDGDQIARVRNEELEAMHEIAEGSTDARGVCPGYKFALTEYPREDQNREYLVTSAGYQAANPAYESGAGGGAGAVFSCRFTGVDASKQFRPPRATPTPVVQGPQTAIVAGNEAIDVDEYGRVKVTFHWDRDRKQSCYVRVSQNWGGANWGGMFIPHVGQEVVVSFLEGDPNRPLITGRVYNDQNMPPVGLPGGKTKSVIRDHGGNEMIMEGADGSQQIRMFSPVANTKFTMGTPNQGHAHLTTDGNQVNHVGSNRTETIDGNVDVTIGGNIDEKISGYFKEEIGTNHESKVGANDKQEVGGNQEITITGKQDVKVNTKDYWNFGTEAKGVVSATQETFMGVKQETKLGLFNEIVGGIKTSATAGLVCEKSKAKVLLEAPMVTSEAKSVHTTKAPEITLDGGSGITLDVSGTMISIGSGSIKIKAGKIKLDGDVKITGNLTDKNDAKIT